MVASRFDWSGLGPFGAVSMVAVALTAWQVAVDRTVFDRFLGPVSPVGAMLGAAVVGTLAMAWLQAHSSFSVLGPGSPRSAAAAVACIVPLLALLAVGADVLLRFDEDANVALPDALRFYPAIAVFVEIALHLVPITALVALFGPVTDLGPSFWRIALPVALVEAVLQAAYAPSVGTAVFSAAHLVVFGVLQVWMFWRFGFMWMLGFRLAYYALWHIGWGVARLQLLF